MDISQMAYIMSLLIMIAGILEFQIMRGYTGEMYYKDFYITNAKQVIQATKAIFEHNQSIYVAFSYSYMLLSGIVLITLYAYINNLMTNAAWIWSGISVVLILLHVLVPYKMTYINFALDAMRRDVDFEHFINNNLMVFKKKKDLEKIKIEEEKFNNLKEDFKNLMFKDYNKYVELVEELKKYRKIKPLPKEQYEKFIGSFPEKEIIVLDKKDNYESIFLSRNKITFIESDPTMKTVFFKMFVPQSFATLMLIRIAEVPMFFLVFLYLIQPR